jgi:hypothetical protein
MNVAVELVDTPSQERVTFRKLPIVIGRDPTADLWLDDPAIPPYQCMIGQGKSKYLTAWNLRTDIPMHVNGQEVSNAELFPGDRLTVGKRQLIVHYELPPQRMSLLS